MIKVPMVVPEKFAYYVSVEAKELGILPSEYIERFVFPLISGENKLICMQLGAML